MAVTILWYDYQEQIPWYKRLFMLKGRSYVLYPPPISIVYEALVSSSRRFICVQLLSASSIEMRDGEN